MKYDFLIVGAGLFGATLAERLTNEGYNVLVVERQSHVGGMCYTESRHRITVHKYGAHIFRTDELEIWNYLDSLSPMKPFVNSPLAYVDGDVYNLPFNMNTFHQLWGVVTPEEAKEKIEEDKVYFENPSNLEEFALSKVGKTIYQMFIKEYTEKQWNKSCTELPASILGRLPLRFTYDNNYYANKPYQGIPENGYTDLIQKMLQRSTVITDVKDWRAYKELADRVIYTGSIDEYYDYEFGALEYRSLEFEETILAEDDVQGVAVVNYPSASVEYTRQIEHKHFLGEKSELTIISREIPVPFDGENERYYPVETERNLELYRKYADVKTSTIFAGRLGQYKYTDMEQTVINARNLACALCNE